MDEIQKSIIDAIKIQVNEKIKDLQFDKTCYGKVVAIRDDTCDVEISGEMTQCKIRNGLQISVNDIVLVRLINNDFSNKFVDAKLGTVGDDVAVDVDWSDIIGKPSSSPSDIDDSVSKKHTHNNLSLLETITQTLVNAWNSAVSHISDAMKHITSSERDLWNTVSNKVDSTEVATTAIPNKILKLDSNAKLPTSITGNADGNAATATKLQTARTISLSGDVTGSANFDGSSNITINATVVDDSHNHVISNIDNLQSILDAKASVSHTHTSSEITDFNEATQNAIGAILTDTSTVDFTYDDTNNQIKADVKPNSSNQKVAVSKNSTTPTGTRKQINFKDGTNISVTVADNATNDAVDVTITNTYTHPTGDGNLHVPATGTTNNNKVLKAGSTAGSLSWGNVDWSELTNKPSSSISSIDSAVTNSHTHSNKALLDTYTQTEANLADAVSKKHAQNTDNTLTSSSSNTINTTGTGNIVDFKVNNTTKSSIDNNGNFTGKSASADKLATARTITLTGDVTGSASFDGSANISISATVADNSHNHVISNIDNLQTTLDSKAPLASPAFTGIPTAPTAPNGTNTNQIATTAFVQNALSAGGYGDMLKSQYDTDSDGIVDRAETADKLTTARTISLSGDIVGNATFDGSADISINTTRLVQNNSFVLDSLYTFTRSSPAYLSDGTPVPANVPRFETGRFGKAIMVEEGTTNVARLIPNLTNLAIGGSYEVNNRRFTRLDQDTYKVEYLTDVVGAGVVVITDNMVWTAGSHTISADILDYYLVPGSVGYFGIGRESFGGPHLHANDGVLGRKAYTYNDTEDRGSLRLAIRATLSNDIIKAGSYMVFRYVQVELNKAYATSYINGTRSPETLTIPTAGILNPQEGTIECWAYVNDASKYRNRYSTIFIADAGGASKGIWLFHENGDNYWRYQIKDENNSVIIRVPDSEITDGWHYFAITWNVLEAKLFVDGVLKGTITNPPLPSTIIRIDAGHWNGTNQFNSLIDDLRISNRARSDAEILAVYQSGQPLPYDANTTWLARFDNNYGLTGNSSGQIPLNNGLLCNNLNAERVNGVKFTVGTTAPSSPQVNDIWIDLS